MRRLVLRSSLCVLIYLPSVWIVGRVTNAVAYLTARSGESGIWEAVHQHPFGRSIVVGFLAGLIPLQLWLSVSGYLRAEIPDFLNRLELEQMKRWVVALFSPLIVLEFLTWIIDWSATHSKRVTVLAESSSMPLSTMFEGFFSTECRNVSDIRLDLWSDNFIYHCMAHISVISAFLTAAGYSLAPLVSRHFLPPVRLENSESDNDSPREDGPESKITGNPDQQ